jgi:hypothetical protein
VAVRPHGWLGSPAGLVALVAPEDALVDEDAALEVVVAAFALELPPLLHEARAATSTHRIARRRIATP